MIQSQYLLQKQAIHKKDNFIFLPIKMLFKVKDEIVKPELTKELAQSIYTDYELLRDKARVFEK